mmetsp:Transcript_28318/g.89451  ORF Transcript_28318/g.89451 Transcript_28318/m.89451 type:complete len:290 (+) Transcript_28318:544-1413(+)
MLLQSEVQARAARGAEQREPVKRRCGMRSGKHIQVPVDQVPHVVNAPADADLCHERQMLLRQLGKPNTRRQYGWRTHRRPQHPGAGAAGQQRCLRSRHRRQASRQACETRRRQRGEWRRFRWRGSSGRSGSHGSRRCASTSARPAAGSSNSPGGRAALRARLLVFSFGDLVFGVHPCEAFPFLATIAPCILISLLGVLLLRPLLPGLLRPLLRGPRLRFAPRFLRPSARRSLLGPGPQLTGRILLPLLRRRRPLRSGEVSSESAPAGVRAVVRRELPWTISGRSLLLTI